MDSRSSAEPASGAEQSDQRDRDRGRPRSMTGRVVWVVDGDTFHVVVRRRLEKVRYIGVNAPEIPHPEARWWKEGGASAHAVNRRLVGGRAVRLELDVAHRDAYGRLLAYVWIVRAKKLLIGDVLTAYDLAPTILDGHDVDDRAVDLWTPLLALAMVADTEAGGGDRAERIVRAARELSDAREADDEAGQAARLVAALQQVAGEIGRMVTPTDLLEALHERGFAWLKSPRGLAGLLAPLGLVARHAREGGRRGRFYVLDPAVLADLATRYNPAANEGPLSHTPEIPPTSVDNSENRS